MFLDEKVIEVRSGKGGDGLCSFRHEIYTPLGGPDGGDGGRGGSVILAVNEQYSTLLDMGNIRLYKAKSGSPGGASRCTGASADDLIVNVPRGTLVKDEEGRILADLTEIGQTWVAAKGGRGGFGNQHFATPSNQAPRKIIPGKPGEKRMLYLELKLMADVGLVGFPNAGKSSLVHKISSARPKIGDYPFTTLEPILGIVQLGSRSFVVADIPGLIEGASEGRGLGHQFLKHIERTHTLLFVIDGFEEDAYEKFKILKKELLGFHPKLAEKPYLIALNKSDLGIEKTQKIFLKKKEKVILTSAITGEGCKELKIALDEMVPNKQKRSKGW
ncbi:MAG TPA: GTPase ObgE [Fibrobacteraceae bacterium]|jgi:GTP-binding protein|nr:GTPase ObgE [Fibrobacter sp.]HPW94192.1 GTPase ObgE [Fibrobacteraceae bacterium]